MVRTTQKISTKDEWEVILISLNNLTCNAFFRITQFILPNSLCVTVSLCKEVGDDSKICRRKCHDFVKNLPLDTDIDDIYTHTRINHILLALKCSKWRKEKLRSFTVLYSNNDNSIIAELLCVATTLTCENFQFAKEISQC